MEALLGYVEVLLVIVTGVYSFCALLNIVTDVRNLVVKPEGTTVKAFFTKGDRIKPNERFLRATHFQLTYSYLVYYRPAAALVVLFMGGVWYIELMNTIGVLLSLAYSFIFFLQINTMRKLLLEYKRGTTTKGKRPTIEKQAASIKAGGKELVREKSLHVWLSTGVNTVCNLHMLFAFFVYVLPLVR